ncbi:MAG: leucine--tRNA ligase [Candidatus Doudnabacteria bacterium]|nr:leucine--tRNA ligase [Candidatus Doudnabacteria bacterium]
MYDHKEIEKKWQEKWEQEKIYKTPKNPDPAKKRYILDMFPYISGSGLHVGHPEGYTATDILSRMNRMRGYDVLHPLGWDAFGLPTENFAIKTGNPPWETTPKYIERFRNQIKSFGFSYDWEREVNTSSPDYYKWTQWLFLLLYKNGLAYKKEASVNWCPKDQTVLANEQVVNGACERCGTVVEQKLLSQWFFKITDFTEDLLTSLDTLDWPEPIKQMQRNWIGRSEGALIEFSLTDIPGQEDAKHFVEVFTTRPDTIFGATFLVISPELAQKWIDVGWRAPQEVVAYISQASKKTELVRIAETKDKTGVDTKIHAINPATKEKIAVWIADYVLGSYGTGAIMAVPAHDERDYVFAKKYDLGIVKVIKPDHEIDDCYEGEGMLINSGDFTGESSSTARSEMAERFGTEKIQYKLRDWLVSRQRYWGSPIPIIYCDKCGMQSVPEQDLPVKLPTDVDFLPTGESPLTRSKSFHDVKCPKCNEPARRDSDTMDTFVDSSWYFFRFTDPNNLEEFASKEQMQKWLPVDTYVGGAEHAVLHLLYARFFTKVLNKLEYISFNEPFKQLRNQGLILGPDGEKMSKSRGNVVNPDEIIEQYGADVFRMYEMFMGPLEDAKPWSTQGMVGLSRFLEKVIRFSEAGEFASSNKNIHKLIKRITSDIENFKFNTAVAAFMEFLNENKNLSQSDWESFLKLLAPFAPHLTEELWQKLGHKESIHLEKWPEFDESLARDDKVEIVISINGKKRGMIEADAGLSEKQTKNLIDSSELFAKLDLANKKIMKVVFVPDRLVNFVVKE